MTELAKKLQSAGIHALTFDLLGTNSNDEKSWDVSEQIESAYRITRTSKLTLIGASYGANNALIYGAMHSNQVNSLCLISPGENYHGLDAVKAAPNCKLPTLIITAKGDPISGDAPKKIYNLLFFSKSLIVVPGSEHGTKLITDSGLQGNIVSFVVKNSAPK